MSHPSPVFLSRLVAAQAAARQDAEKLVHRARAEGREKLSDTEAAEFADLKDTIDTLGERINEMRADVERAGAGNPMIERLLKTGGMDNARYTCPINFGEGQLRRAYEQLKHGETARLEARAFSTADSLIPPQLWGLPVGPVFEPRLANFLPSIPTDAPSIEFVIHGSTTGTAAVVTEGSSKPELVFNTDKDIVTPAKIAAHVGASYEVINDFPTFYSYVNSELTREVVQVENSALINGDGTGAITGFLNTSGILTYVAGSDFGGSETPLDSIEIALAKMRTGTSLAEADLFVVHPSCWSAIRRVKDTLGRYLVSPDPTIDEPDRVWGVRVLPSTQIAVGTGLLLANGGSMNAQYTGQVSWGNLVVRESLTLRVGYSGDDFVKNILRTIAEERIGLAIERPSAVLKISGLPTGVGSGS